MAKNSPDTKSQTQEAQSIPIKNRTGADHKQTAKNEEKILKEAVCRVGGEAHVSCSRTRLWVTQDFSRETTLERKEWNEISKMFKRENHHQSRILYQQNYPSKVKGKWRLGLIHKKRSRKFSGRRNTTQVRNLDSHNERKCIPWPGMEPMPPAVEAWSPNHWTTRQRQLIISPSSVFQEDSPAKTGQSPNRNYVKETSTLSIMYQQIVKLLFNSERLEWFKLSELNHLEKVE